MNPLITVVTPSYNHERFIEATIQSVLTQDYAPIEFIIMDGGSTDGTLDVLRKYEDRLTWYSEPDKGQGDAINRGFRRATGEIWCWLNSDDLFLPGALKTVAQFFQQNPDAHFVYGDAEAITLEGKPAGMRTHIRPSDFDSLLHKGDYIVQPAAFWRADLWRTIGELDLQWQYVLDYEYWIRAARRYQLHYIPKPLAQERIYAAAKTFRGGIERIQELDEMPRRFGGNGVASGFRPEAAAMYIARGWSHLKHGRRAEAQADFSTGLRLNNNLPALGVYLTALALRGEAGIPGMRLQMNRVRGILQKATGSR